MVTRGPVYPKVAANVAGIGGDAWSSPMNGRFDDGVVTSFTDTGSGSNYIQFTGFDLRIPSGETVKGITMEFKRYASDSSSSGSGRRINDVTVSLIKAGTITGNNYAKTATADRWPLLASIAYQTYGGATDLWGTTWTPAELNASNFGVAIAAVGNRGDGTEEGDIVACRITVSGETGAVYCSDGYIDLCYPTLNYFYTVQQISIAIGSGAASATQTVDRVGTGTAVIFPGGFISSSTGTNPAITLPRLELTNATTVTAYRNTSDTSTVTVKGTLIYFNSNAVASIQQGTIVFASGDATKTATITSVGTGNSMVINLGNTTAKTTSSSGETVPSLTLTNATTVTATRGVTGTALTVGYAVIEFKPGIVKSLQQLTSTLNSSNNTDNVTITAVNPQNTIIGYGGMNSTGSTFSNTQATMKLTTQSNIAFFRAGVSTGNRNYQYAVMEFIPGVLDNILRDSLTFSSGSSTTATVPTTLTSLGVCSQIGYISSGSATQYNQVFSNLELTNSTTVTTARGTSAAFISGSGYELFTFN